MSCFGHGKPELEFFCCFSCYLSIPPSVDQKYVHSEKIKGDYNYIIKAVHSLQEIVHSNKYCSLEFEGSRDSAVVRALASHQCVPGSIGGLGVICELSLLLVLFLAPRGFSLDTQVFPLLKNQHFQIPI